MRIESGNGDTTLYLERGEHHEDRVVGENCVHAIFDAAGRRIYTYVDVGAAAAPFRPHVRIRRPWGSGWDGERLPFLELADSLVAYALSGAWRRGVRVAS
jgi:hypothetical protein